MQNIKIIQNLAVKLEEHPIHIRMFFLHQNSIPECYTEACLMDTYREYRKNGPRPFVKWVGGKRQLAKQFRDLDLYPPIEFDPKTATYFEPFIGGGAMFFDLRPKMAILSDMNYELVTTYNVIKNNPDDLIKKLKEHQKKNSKEYYLKIRAQKVDKLSAVSIAARFIYLNRTGFNGLYRVNKSGGFNVPYGQNKNPLICDEVNLCKVYESLKKTKILHQDYKKVLKSAKKGDFIYFDPPYYPVNKTSAFTSYVKESFLEKEQTELRDVFVELHNRGCFVMLSNSDTPFINELYSNLGKKIKIKKVFAGRSINSKGSGRGKVSEVVVINY